MLLLALAVAAASPWPGSWAQFSREGALSRIVEMVEIASDDRTRTTPIQYRLRLTRTRPGHAAEVRFAEGRNCPAVHAMLVAMRAIRMPSPAPYGIPGPPGGLVIDGTSYMMTAPSTDTMGTITLRSNVNSPLAQWVDGSLTALAPCWTDIAP